MNFTEEFISDNGLSNEQVEAVKGFYETNVIPELKKDWDGLANDNAEGILTGAAKYGASKFGVELEREQGEKWGDYLKRISDISFDSSKKKLEEKELELQKKLENFKGGDEYKSQIDLLTQEKDELLRKIAELEPLTGFDKKYKQASEELNGLKLNVAFNEVKPSFPETVNKYEASAKWNEFKTSVLDKNTIELVDNVPYAIDKENPHKKTKLSELVDGDSNIKELLKGRQQSGNGASSVDFKKVDGIPFDIPKNATSDEISKLTREYLTKKLGSATSPKFASEFAELFAKIKNAA